MSEHLVRLTTTHFNGMVQSHGWLRIPVITHRPDDGTVAPSEKIGGKGRKRVRSFIATFGCGVRLAYFFLSPDEAIPGLSYPDTAPARAAVLIMKLEAEDYLEILVSS